MTVEKSMRGVLVLLGVFVAGCGGGVETQTEGMEPGEHASVLFEDGTATAGLDFVHWNGMSGELYLSEITCGAGALFDYDGDGDLDAYLLQGHMRGADKTVADALLPPAYPEPLADRLYRNDPGPGGAVFTDVTAGLGVDVTGYGCGVAAGDFDNDGRVDLYVANLGRNQLLRNLGGGAFRDVATDAGVDDPLSGVAAAFVDIDRDGWLDLFVGNNVAFDDGGTTVCHSLAGGRDYCGPSAYPAQPDRLYRNRGDGTFEDVTEASGLAAAPRRPTLGVVTGDFDGDGFMDLYVANDGEPNNLWLSRRDDTGRVRFSDEALLAGCALNRDGESEASMGVDAADYDGDGDLDLFLSHLVKETNTLYRNNGQGIFADATTSSGLGPPSLPFTTFGAGFLDVDNDGHLDLLVVNGAVTLIPELVAADDPFPLHQPNQLFLNTGGGGRFEEVTSTAGPAFALSEVSRGAVFGDVDNDGDEDVLVINNGGPARLLVNRAGQEHSWLGLRLVTGAPPRVALGARAAILRGGRPELWRRVQTDGSYSSANDPRVLFGLGDDPAVDGVRVIWPDGMTEDWSGLEPGAYHTLRQGESRTAAEDTAAEDDPFADVAAAVGLDFVHQNGMRGDFHMAELMGAGGAFFDADNDGDLDVYLVQGGALESPEERPADQLLRNDLIPGGALRFHDVTAVSGFEAAGYGMGVATGDYDNDGWIDLYLTNDGANQLWRNRGPGAGFEDVTASAGAGDERWSVPASFFDYDGDGWLDLYVGNYLAYDPSAARHCAGPSGQRDYCGAALYPGVADRLLRNLGRHDGSVSFEPVDLDGGAGRALGAVSADLDGDGRVDLYVGNDAGPNHMWLYRPGDGTFRDEALLAGTALNRDGASEASMGIDVADYDGDGDGDLFLTHLVVETHTLYTNRGQGLFEDTTTANGLAGPSRVHTGFGTAFFDYDHDGRPDLFVANGAVQNIAELAAAGDLSPFHEVNQLFRNLGGGRFEEVSERAGAAFELSEVSRGVAAGDVDNDGDVDLLVTQNNGPVRLLLRRGAPPSWLGLRLVTGDPPRDALGAEVTLELADGTTRWGRVATDGSYASASDPRLVFALGDGRAENVRVRWSDGTRETFPAPDVGRYAVLRQGDPSG